MITTQAGARGVGGLATVAIIAIELNNTGSGAAAAFKEVRERGKESTTLSNFLYLSLSGFCLRGVFSINYVYFVMNSRAATSHCSTLVSWSTAFCCAVNTKRLQNCGFYQCTLLSCRLSKRQCLAFLHHHNVQGWMYSNSVEGSERHFNKKMYIFLPPRYIILLSLQGYGFRMDCLLPTPMKGVSASRICENRNHRQTELRISGNAFLSIITMSRCRWYCKDSLRWIWGGISLVAFLSAFEITSTMGK